MGIELEDCDAPYQELGRKIQQVQEETQARQREEARYFQEQEQQEREAMLVEGKERIERALDDLLGSQPEAGQVQRDYDNRRAALRAEMLQDLEEDIALLFDEGEEELDAAHLDDIEDLDEFLNEQAEKIYNSFNKNTDKEETQAAALSSATFQRLFRATAAKLHPDREPDPALRDEKQRLMATLLKARKRGDIVTVVDLYNTWVGEHNALSQSDEKALHEAMQQWVNTLEREEQEIISESPLHYHVYKQYHHSSATKVDRAVEQRIHALNRAVETNEMLGVTLTSLKSLKPWLEDRFEQHRWSLGY